MTVRHDEEHSLNAQTRLTRDGRGHNTYLELAPAANNHSVGPIERANREVASQAKSLETVFRGVSSANSKDG